MGVLSISPELMCLSSGCELTSFNPLVREVSPFAGLEAFGFMAPALFMYLMMR